MIPAARMGGMAAVIALSATVIGCASGSSSGPRGANSAAGETSSEGSLDNRSWGTFHSKRFEASLQLPDGARWRIDDHRTAWLKAEHPPSKSSLWLRSWNEDATATRKLCYARAREWLPTLPDLEGAALIEDRVRPLFNAIDTRVAVGVRSAEGAPLGFVIASGAEVHRCFVLAFVTRAEGAGAEDEVASRLVLVSERLLPKVQLDQSLAPSRERATPSLPGVPAAAR